jgi:hypothetical protein
MRLEPWCGKKVRYAYQAKVQIAMELKWWYFTCSNEFTLPPTYSTPWLVYDWLLLFTILFGGVYFILYKWQHGIFYYEVYF